MKSRKALIPGFLNLDEPTQSINPECATLPLAANRSPWSRFYFNAIAKHEH
jgi:hypothetical protein